MTTTTAAPTAPAHLASHLHALRLARSGFLKMFEGIPADKHTAQPGSCVNHPLWTLGHMASTDDYMLGEFGTQKSTLPENWSGLFGMGSKPVEDASHYPSFAEVKKALDDRRAALERWVLTLTPQQLATPTSPEWQPYAPTIGDALFFVAWHEGYHTGQLAPFRRAIKLGPAFG